MSNGWSGADPTQFDDGPGSFYELGSLATVNGDLTLSHVRVWHGVNSGVVVVRQARLWTIGGQLIDSVSLPDTLPPGWTTYALATPLERLTGSQFVVSYTTRQYYGAMAGGYPKDSLDGLLTYSSGRFIESGLGLFPTTPTASFYGIDVVYNAGVGGNVSPVVTASVVAEGLDASLTVVAVDESPGTVAYTVEWGDGTTSSGPGPVFNHSYVSPGTYVILVTATDIGGLKDSTALMVTVHGIVSAETIAQRSITQAFIESNPTLVTLVPRTRVTQRNGSWALMDGDPRSAQVMRVIEQAPPAVVTVEDGTQRSLDYVLLANWDAEIATGDRFIYNGDYVRVVELYHNNGYEVRAALIRDVNPPVQI